MARKTGVIVSVAEFLSHQFPRLGKKLVLADMKQSTEEFLQKAVLSSLLLSFTLFVVTALVLSYFGALSLEPDALPFSLLLLLLILISYLIVFFFYFNFYPDVMILKRKRELDY